MRRLRFRPGTKYRQGFAARSRCFHRFRSEATQRDFTLQKGAEGTPEDTDGIKTSDVMPDRPPCDMRNDQPDKAQESRKRHDGARQKTCKQQSAEPQGADGNAEAESDIVAVCSRSPATASRIRHRKYLRFW